MSASTPRGQRGGSPFRGARGAMTSAGAGRGSAPGSRSSFARGRGRGRAGAAASASGQGLLQQLRSGTLQRNPQSDATQAGRGEVVQTAINRPTSEWWLTSSTGRGERPATPPSARGRGRGFISKTFIVQSQSSSAPVSRTSSPAPAFSMNDTNARFQSVSAHLSPCRLTATLDS